MIKNKKWVFIGLWVVAILPILVFLIPTWIRNPGTHFSRDYLTSLYISPFVALCTTLILSAIDRVYARLQQCLPPADETQEPKE